MNTSSGSATPTVVLVEDDAASRTALARVLRAAGFDTTTFESAEAFLAALPRIAPICCVLDIQLGGMSGLDLQRTLRDEGSKVPVIIMTSFDEPRLRTQAFRDGCLEFLSKEADAGQLLALLRSL